MLQHIMIGAAGLKTYDYRYAIIKCIYFKGIGVRRFMNLI